jgi:hypothetical protein
MHFESGSLFSVGDNNCNENEEWGHECWDCTGAFMTNNKVANGIPYFILTHLYRFFGSPRGNI